jgi:hypothetical protein
LLQGLRIPFSVNDRHYINPAPTNSPCIVPG